MTMCFTIYHENTNLYSQSQIENLQDLRMSLFLVSSKQTMGVDRTKEGYTVTMVTDSRWENVHNLEEPLIVCIHLHISIFLRVYNTLPRQVRTVCKGNISCMLCSGIYNHRSRLMAVYDIYTLWSADKLVWGICLHLNWHGIN